MRSKQNITQVTINFSTIAIRCAGFDHHYCTIGSALFLSTTLQRNRCCQRREMQSQHHDQQQSRRYRSSVRFQSPCSAHPFARNKKKTHIIVNCENRKERFRREWPEIIVFGSGRFLCFYSSDISSDLVNWYPSSTDQLMILIKIPPSLSLSPDQLNRRHPDR